MTLPLIGDDIVHLDTGTYMWVQLSHFRIDPDHDDQYILESLIESPGYHHDYASPFPPAEKVRAWGIHGRWEIDAIHSGLFPLSTAEAAKAEIDVWANDEDWTDPEYTQPPEAIQRLQPIYALLSSGTVRKLNNPPREAEHAYGHITGTLGFHEFIVINRVLCTLHVIVASDD